MSSIHALILSASSSSEYFHVCDCSSSDNFYYFEYLQLGQYIETSWSKLFLSTDIEQPEGSTSFQSCLNVKILGMSDSLPNYQCNLASFYQQSWFRFIVTFRIRVFQWDFFKYGGNTNCYIIGLCSDSETGSVFRIAYFLPNILQYLWDYWLSRFWFLGAKMYTLLGLQLLSVLFNLMMVFVISSLTTTALT